MRDAEDLVGEDTDDLDAAQPAGASAAGATVARLPRWARSRWALPVAATAAVLLVGAAGIHQARVAATADLDRAEQLAGVQLSTPTVVLDGRGTQRDATGRLLRQVQVLAFNAGTEPVQITPVATSLTAAELLPSERPLSLAPSAGGLLALPLAVDCSAVPPLDQVVTIDPATGVADAGGETTWVRLAVDVDGERTERRYLVPGQSRTGGLTEQLSVACSPNARARDATASTEVDAEGRLRVAVTNTSGEPVRVLLASASGLRTSSDVPLPAEVPAGSSRQLVLSLDPVCAVVAADAGGYPPQVGISLDLGDGATEELSDSTVTTAWVARQVALRCG